MEGGSYPENNEAPAPNLPPHLQNSTPIQNYTYTYTRVATRMNIRCIQLNLYESAIFSVELYDDSYNHVTTKSVILEGEEYSNWGNSDDYIKTIIASKLGLNLPSQ